MTLENLVHQNATPQGGPPRLRVTIFLTQPLPPHTSPTALLQHFLECFVQAAKYDFGDTDASHPPIRQLPEIRFNERYIQSDFATSVQLQDVSLYRHNSEISGFEKDYGVTVILDSFPASKTSKSLLRPLRLALFDMDSTLIDQEVIDELARSIGKTDAVSTITARAMNGELNFEASLRERVAMLRGVKADVWNGLRSTITIASGARELLRGLHDMGVVTAVVSGGFLPMAEWLKGELGLTYAHANVLETSPSTDEYPYEHLTGTLAPEHSIITPERKRDLLCNIASSHKIPLSETLAVGDGSNDLLMLDCAAVGIAYNAKQRVQDLAPLALNGSSLADILYVVGLEGPEHTTVIDLSSK